MARWVPAPGDSTARLYVWLVFVSPVALLILSVWLVVYGVRRGSEGVATIGALGVVVSLVLPRMKGSFEFGPKGFKGGLWDELFEEFVRRGFAPAEASELATEEAAAAVQASADDVTWEHVVKTPSPFAAVVASRRVGNARSHEQAVRRIVEAIAKAHGWQLRDDLEIKVRGDAPPWRKIDAALDTPYGLKLIEGADVMAPGNRLDALALWMRRAKEESDADEAIVVVPDSSGLVTGEVNDVTVIKLSELDDAITPPVD